MTVTWERKNPEGYEVSSVGDQRFSAFHAIMPDGRSIEHWYQCDIKGYDFGGRNWKKGKGQPSLIPYPDDGLYQMYLSLWRYWAIRHQAEIMELAKAVGPNGVLTDCFASTPINQARALAQILNEWVFI